jgi:hypothetical protein
MIPARGRALRQDNLNRCGVAHGCYRERFSMQRPHVPRQADGRSPRGPCGHLQATSRLPMGCSLAAALTEIRRRRSRCLVVEVPVSHDMQRRPWEGVSPPCPLPRLLRDGVARVDEVGPHRHHQRPGALVRPRSFDLSLHACHTSGLALSHSTQKRIDAWLERRGVSVARVVIASVAPSLLPRPGRCPPNRRHPSPRRVPHLRRCISLPFSKRRALRHSCRTTPISAGPPRHRTSCLHIPNTFVAAAMRCRRGAATVGDSRDVSRGTVGFRVALQCGHLPLTSAPVSRQIGARSCVTGRFKRVPFRDRSGRRPLLARTRYDHLFTTTG